MLTNDDIKAIVDTISPLIQAEGKAIRKNTISKNDLISNNKIIGKIITIELASIKQEIIEAMKAGFYEAGKMIREVRDEIHNEKLDQLEERVKKLEQQQSRPHH